MFTGIIEDFAQIVSINKQKDCWQVILENPSILKESKIGESLSVNGVCLTIASKNSDGVLVEIINETLNKTNLSFLKVHDKVNIERSLKLSDRLNGHFVQGHIECLSRIQSKKTDKNETKLIVEIKEEYLKYCIYKGSICLDGISLTISNIGDNTLELSIIPHTLNNTTLSFKKEGDYLNVETDMLSKYIEKNIKVIR